MATNIQSSRLDFNNIKSRLKTYLVAKPEFTDYDFEASGLNNILDVLAYNTHFNGLTANFALNESFLNTAQLRSSVVSHAETLGYTPRSRSASVAFITLTLTVSAATRPSSITIPRYTAFTSTVAGVTYTFRTIAAFTATDNAGSYSFLTAEGSTSIPIYQGVPKTKTFFVSEVDDRQLYVLPDNSIDTTTMKVDVYDSPTSSTFTTYTLLDLATSVTTASTYYNIHEAPNGYYEVHFSDGITFGKAPISGNKIEISYLSVVGEDANGGVTFSPVSPIAVLGVNYPLATALVSTSAAGSPKQTTESIRQNAPIAFAAQQRLVTADDYKALVLKNYPVIADAAAWGGHDNIPKEYGKVYISLSYIDNTSAATKTATETSITNNLTDKLGVISISTEYVEPINTFLKTITNFQFSSGSTGLNKNILEQNVQTVINDYFTTNCNAFGGIFRRSNLLSEIDALDPGILNTTMSIVAYQTITPTLGVSQSYSVIFPIDLASGSATPLTNTITSSTFIVDTKVCSIKNLLGTNTLQLIDDTSAIIIDNLGSYDNLTGVVSIEGLTVASVSSGNDIEIRVVPANSGTVIPLRNYIIKNDPAGSSVSGTVES